MARPGAVAALERAGFTPWPTTGRVQSYTLPRVPVDAVVAPPDEWVTPAKRFALGLAVVCGSYVELQLLGRTASGWREEASLLFQFDAARDGTRAPGRGTARALALARVLGAAPAANSPYLLAGAAGYLRAGGSDAQCVEVDRLAAHHGCAVELYADTYLATDAVVTGVEPGDCPGVPLLGREVLADFRRTDTGRRIVLTQR